MIPRRAFLAGAAALAGCSTRRRLNVFNWSDYIAPATIPAFELERGVRIRYGTYESAEEMLARLLTGNSGWDVVVTPQNYLTVLADAGLLAPLDHALVANLANLDHRFAAPPWDPKLAWSVPYLTGSTGIAYHESVDPPPRAWADLWSERFRRKLTMLDDPLEVFGACLKKLGLSVNSTDPAELSRSAAEARAQKPLLRAYLNAEVRSQLAAGDVAVAQVWATTARLAQDDSPHVRFAHPAEGFALACDNLVILRESRRRDLAHEFLNYLLRPEVAAEIALAARSATPNLAALALLPEDFRRDPALYPPAATLARGEWFTALPASAQRLRDRLWTEIKSA